MAPDNWCHWQPVYGYPTRSPTVTVWGGVELSVTITVTIVPGGVSAGTVTVAGFPGVTTTPGGLGGLGYA